jgi:tetratricopeptide (TPR) repeat protein
MRKNILLLSLLLISVQWSAAQAPKWMEKAKKAVFSVITYDGENKMLNTGNGFFVSEDGVALSDYSLFKGAQRAVIINTEGVQMPVNCILGANDIYDVVKFRVSIVGKKVAKLDIAPTAVAVDAPVYLLPYSTQKDRSYKGGTVKEADKDGAYTYYTLNLSLKEKMVSCPVMNEAGEVFGMAQKSSGKDTATICYAVAADYIMAQHITPLSYNSTALHSIGIKKGLPDTEEQALVYLYMISATLTPERYSELLNDFIEQFPRSSDGYMRRATHNLYLAKDGDLMPQVEADMDKALELSKKKDDAYYNRSKLIYAYQATQPESVYKDWTYDRALAEVRKALAVDPLPVYTQFEGDILFAMKDYPAALACYEKINTTNLASPATFFSAAKTKEMMGAPAAETLALLDSCITRFPQPYTSEAAPYLLERAQVRMTAGEARNALADYDAYFTAVNGQVNDLFYYYREQAALAGRLFQRALDDIAQAIELNPKELTYRAELAVINIRVGRYEEAVKDMQAALAIDPNYGEAYRLMGIARLQLKQQTEACEDFARAKALGDTNVDSLIQKNCK